MSSTGLALRFEDPEDLVSGNEANLSDTMSGRKFEPLDTISGRKLLGRDERDLALFFVSS